jgi:capsular exopolysaccharide synthesis family protein
VTTTRSAVDARGPDFVEEQVRLTAVPATTSAFIWPGSQVGEGLRVVAARIQAGPMASLFKSFAITSCVEGDGKTSTAVGLAAVLSSGGLRTVVVDADLRRRSTSEVLGIEPARGLAEWLEAGEQMVPLLKIAPGDFTLVSAGIGSCRPEALASPRMLRLLKALEGRFDRIILDTAPLLPVADTLGLCDRVGGFLLVVRSQHTPRAAVTRAISLLGADRFLGLVLNDYETRLSRGGRHYGYGYGYGYGGYNRR